MFLSSVLVDVISGFPDQCPMHVNQLLVRSGVLARGKDALFLRTIPRSKDRHLSILAVLARGPFCRVGLVVAPPTLA